MTVEEYKAEQFDLVFVRGQTDLLILEVLLGFLSWVSNNSAN